MTDAIFSIPAQWPKWDSTITRSDEKLPRHNSHSSRQIALHALGEWRTSGRFADAVLHELLARSDLHAADRAFATELLYGVVRNLRLLDFWLSVLRPASLDAETRDLLRIGLYQLLMLSTAEHAAVYETVELAQPRASRLVNGVLRSAQRRRAELLVRAAEAPLPVRTSHPDFLVERWQSYFGREHAAALCEWNNQPPQIYARVNQLKTSAADFRLAHPEAAEVNAKVFRFDEVPVDELRAGNCYIQDPSTLLACELLNPRPGERLLDACAAPGGKTGYIAELMHNSGTIIAADRDAARVETLRGNLERLGVAIASLVEHDWSSSDASGPIARAAPFDRILLDAPCSNTGVMRRRADVRWRLRRDDFERMQQQQLAISRAVLRLLKPGGAFVYSTCSIEPEENEQVTARLSAEFPALQLDAQQTRLPFRDGVDGAFAAKFTLRS